MTLETIKGYLKGCGYRPELLRSGFRFGRDRMVDLMTHITTEVRKST